MDDARLGLAIRALRRRRRWRQADLARAAGVSQATISLLERGHIQDVTVRVVRRVVEALDGRANFQLHWRGAGLDRLIDERHAWLGAAVVTALERSAWSLWPEATYSRYGERGSIDLLGWHAATRTLLIVELKTDLGSVEETLRKHDEKVRLAPRIALEGRGWRAAVVARLLVIADDRTARRRWAAVEPLLRSAMPNSSVDVKRWIRQPRGALAGVWFLPLSAPGSASPSFDSRERVRLAKRTPGERGSSSGERGHGRSKRSAPGHGPAPSA